MALSLGFILRANTEEAEAAIKRLEGAGERAALAIEGNFVGASRGIASGIAGIIPTIGIAAAAVGALGGGILALASHAAEYGNKLYEASIRTGLSARQLSGLAAAARLTGHDFDSLVMTIGRGERALGAAIINPATASAQVILKLAGGADKLKQMLSGPDGTGEALQALLKHIFALHSPTERAVALTGLFGRGWMSNVEVLKLLANEGFGPLIEKAKQWNMLYDDKQIAQAHVFTEQMNSMKAQISGLGLSFGQQLIPYVQRFMLMIAATKPALEEFGLRLKAIALALAGGRGSTVEAALAWAEANKKGEDSLDAMREAADKMQEAMAGALKTIQDGTKGTEELGKVLKESAKAMLTAKEDADLMAAAQKGLNSYLLEAQSLMAEVWGRLPREATKSYGEMRAITDELIAQQHRLADARKEAQKGVVETPDVGENAEMTDRIRTSTEQLNEVMQRQREIFFQVTESFRQYHDRIIDVRGVVPFFMQQMEQVVSAHQRGMPVLKAFMLALADEGEAAKKAAKEGVAAQTESLLAMIIGRKAMAIVEATVETARGLADLAVHNYWGATYHFLSAAEWGVVAGKSGGGHSGGGGGEQTTPEAGPGKGRAPGVVGGDRSGGDRYHQSIVNIYGGAILDTHNLSNLVAMLNSGGQTGVVKLSTGGSAYSIPNPAY